VLLLALLGRPLWAQQSVESILHNRVHLSDVEIAQVRQGQVVAKALDSPDKKYGILVFGAVYINAPVDKFLDTYRDTKMLLQDKVYLDVQEFSVNGVAPHASDFDRLKLDNSSIDDLKDCKPNDCDIQVFNFQTIPAQFDWKSKDRYEVINKLFRQSVQDGMTRYLSGGLKALGSYEDREHPFDVYVETKQMIDLSFYLPQEKSAGIYHRVVDYPAGRVTDGWDYFYWENIDFGQGPTIRVNHVAVFPKGAGAAKLIIANKQLYSSRYIRIALQMFYCIPDDKNPGNPGFFLVEINDSRTPDFSGLKQMIARKIAKSKGIESTQNILNLYATSLNTP
jgi:hypothetical protein